MKDTKDETFEINNFRLKILVTPFKYNGMAVNVEQVGYIFKYNIYDYETDNWYSHYVTDEASVKKKPCKCCGQKELVTKNYTPNQIAVIAENVVDMAKATIDLILNKDNVEELIEDNMEGSVITEALEENISLGKKEQNAKEK